jgi:signal transduction histidine kinase
MLNFNLPLTSERLISGYGVAVLLVISALISLLLMETRWQASAPVSMFLLVVIISTWLGGMKPGLLATVLSILCFDYFLLHLDYSRANLPIHAVRLLTLAIVAFYVVWVTTTERNAAKSLRESAKRLHFLSRRLLTVQEEERRHLSRELHDEFGQLLATITLHLHAAKAVAGEAAQPGLEESMALLQRAGAQVRSLALELRPTMLETGGLEAALRWLAEQHQQRTGITTQVVGHVSDVSGDPAIAAFRVAQEALTNVVRHARAQHVWIELSQGDGLLELVVRDDGVGFDVTQTLERTAGACNLGLLGMKERVEILSGTLEIVSQPLQGTRIRISLPLAEPTAMPGVHAA